MRAFISFVIISIPVMLFAQNVTNSNGVNWTTDLNWKEVKDKAKSDNKFIFIDAYATWCVPCKKMDQQVFVDKAVKDFVNDNFISVKIQMDKTSLDNGHVKAWYPVANLISNEYKPEGFPCFLFLTPDGQLAYKGLGFQSSERFIEMCKQALKNPLGQYELQIDQFNKGILDFKYMPILARLARERKNRDLSREIAMKYKVNYLDKLSEDSVFTKDKLLFLVEFYYDIVNSKDRYFNYFYKFGPTADQIMDFKVGKSVRKLSEAVVNGIIIKEEITDKLYNNGTVIERKPNWEKIIKSIRKKYNDNYAKKLVPDRQIWYYKDLEDWRNYVYYINRKLKVFPPKLGGKSFGEQFGDSWHLNNYAWDLFEKCNEKDLLKDAVKWCDYAIRCDTSQLVAQYLDTKANILYKLGNVEDAINLQKNAVKMTTSKDLQDNLSKMEKGIPTWK